MGHYSGIPAVAMAGVDNFLALLSDFDEILSSTESKENRRKCIIEHFEKLDKNRPLLVPDFDKDLDWLNVSEPLTFSCETSLKGKVVVLDFFTYCCINCLHVLPQLHQLEKEHPPEEGLVVVGVHSAKFLNEKVTSNILSAVLRYNITHPVVNDSDTALWKKLSVVCWPTFVIVGPAGQVLYYIVGEGHSERMFEIVSLALEYYGSQGALRPHSLPVRLERDRLLEQVLSFPGKLQVGPTSQHLVVSDTGHHRILVIDRITGVIQTCIGGREKGFKDGSLQEALFNSPQGVATLGNLLFVADTENHALRQVDLSTGQVSTLAGTGVQGEDKVGGNAGTKQALSSPWDVAVGVSPGSQELDVLYIAMAGTHQIWAYFLKDVSWWKNKQYKAGVCACIAGSGNEENRNNSYPDKASFAQPSGLAVSHTDRLSALFVADSESSTVRSLSLKDGCVRNVVGGDRDPQNLFVYGDKDGCGLDVRLQHPLGLALLSPSGPLLLADSYNHKIKCIDITSKQCNTVKAKVETKADGTGDGLDLDEPGGICVDPTSQLVYIADTNHHCIKVFNWSTETVSKLPVIQSLDSSRTELDQVDAATLDQGQRLPPVTLKPGGSCTFVFDLHLAPGIHGNTEAPNGWSLRAGDAAGRAFLSRLSASQTKGSIIFDASFPVPLTTLTAPEDVSPGGLALLLTCQVFVCYPDRTCRQIKQQYLQVINISAADGESGQRMVAELQVSWPLASLFLPPANCAASL